MGRYIENGEGEIRGKTFSPYEGRENRQENLFIRNQVLQTKHHTHLKKNKTSSTRSPVAPRSLWKHVQVAVVRLVDTITPLVRTPYMHIERVREPRRAIIVIDGPQSVHTVVHKVIVEEEVARDLLDVCSKAQLAVDGEDEGLAVPAECRVQTKKKEEGKEMRGRVETRAEKSVFGKQN